MPFILSLLFGFLPMFFYAGFIYWLDRYEKEPTSLLGSVFLWGAIVAAGAAYLINTTLGIGVYLFTGSEVATNLTTGSLVAPIVEESLKGLAVWAVFLLFRTEFDSYLDGVVYAAVTALGFAATENALYIYKGYLESGYSGLLWLVFIRVILVGWQHPFYTAFIGIGLAKSRLTKTARVKYAAPILGWSIAVFNHSLHNTIASLLTDASGLLIGSIVDWTGWLFLFGFIVWAIYHEKRYLAQQLANEVEIGTISASQYRTACSTWAQSRSHLNALFSGHYLETRRYYQKCAELAHKKHQHDLLWDELETSAIIEKLRAELRDLSPLVS